MPALGDVRQTIAIPFGAKNLERCGYPMVKKFDDTFRRFDRIPACDERTDGQKSCDSIA